jgi:hypothetical protein
MTGESGKTVRIHVQQAIPRGQSANLSTICEGGPFKLRQILVSPVSSGHFVINDVKVGRNSQFISAASVPAAFFAESNQEDELHFDTLPRGRMITLSVTRISPPDPPRTESKGSLWNVLLRRPKKQQTTSIADLDEVVRRDVFSAVLVGEVETDPHTYDVPSGSRGRLVMGIGHHWLKPNEETNLLFQGAINFKPDRLMFGASEGVRLIDVRIAGTSVLPKDALAGARLHFARWSFDGPEVLPGDWFVVLVRNDTSERQFCGGAFSGNSIG